MSRDSSEAELLAMWSALDLWVGHGQGWLLIEGDSSNGIKWASGRNRPPWKLILMVKDI